MGQSSLLRTRRFAGIFWTQFLGAFNDNLLKNALVILIAYRSLSVLGLSPETLVALCGGLFILPFFLFSATAGELADRFAKHRLVRDREDGRDRHHGRRRGRLLADQPVAAARRALPDGHALEHLRTGQVQHPAAAARAPTSWSAATRWSRWAPSSRSCSARSAAASRSSWGDPGLAVLGGFMIAVAASGVATSFLVPAVPAQNPTLRIDAEPGAADHRDRSS